MTVAARISVPDTSVKPRTRNHRSRFVLRRFVGCTVALSILIAYGIAYGGVVRLNGELNNARHEVKEWKERNHNLQRRLSYLKTDEYVESVARRELGLVKEGEVLVVLSKNIQHN